MKKNALNFIELFVAMILIAVIALITIRGLEIFVKNDTDYMKFKPVMGSVSSAVYQLITDSTMYPLKKGFAYLNEASYPDDDKKYGGPSKFRKLFKSKFNILNDELKFPKNLLGEVASYKISIPNPGGGTIDKDVDVDFNDLHCFTENKGVTFCLGDIKEEDANKLSSIYIRVYLNSVDPEDIKTYHNTRAIYFEVSSTGKISLPIVLETEAQYIFNCANNAYKNFAQCVARSILPENDVHYVKNKVKN